jgi:tetratricopeptide (TPR) repeat protein
MVRIMEKLEGLCYAMGNMSQPEHWYRRVITARQQLADTNSVEALQTCLDLIDAIIDQGRWVEAKNLHQEIYPSILEKVDQNHRLVQQSLKILARISSCLDEEEEAEVYSRQLLQLRLNAYGLWIVLTLIAMQLLATPLRNKAIYAECEDLLCIVLQLQSRIHDTSDHSKCVAIVSFAEVLFHQRRYKEGRPLFQRAVELAEYNLGGEHTVSLYCSYLLARSLHIEGLLTESKELLEANLEKQIRLLGETEINTRMQCLGLAKYPRR